MFGVIHSEFDLAISGRKLKKCIEFLELGLRALSDTPYHEVLGRDYLHHAEEASDFIVDFYDESLEEGAAEALYFEMNGFTINPDQWYFEGFSYESSALPTDLTCNTEWLSRWTKSTKTQFVLDGLNPVQTAFERLYGKRKQALGVQLAGEIAEHLVVARFDELIEAAHAVAKRKRCDLKKIPVFSAAHDWETLYPLQ